MTIRLGLALLMAVALVGGAQAQSTFQRAMQIQMNVPLCHEHRDYRWEGRLSGNAMDPGNDRAVPVSFLGCFPTKAECEAWLGPATGFVTGRLIFAKCQER
ncbi:hypothetical protein [Amorphus orientalis]|uniref:Uncharacterized protein n=1 Tax=Amorphus orientalis TaxID=649198 RepID=A0AAE3VSC5_9HYPH|nr:hypothetical protein [Amorphus orientalis]MDQ0317315.1 hypothetical protein [Amorphus orientalis]